MRPVKVFPVLARPSAYLDPRRTPLPSALSHVSAARPRAQHRDGDGLALFGDSVGDRDPGFVRSGAPASSLTATPRPVAGYIPLDSPLHHKFVPSIFALVMLWDLVLVLREE